MPEYIRPFGFIILRVWTSAFLFFMMWRFLSFEKIEKQDRLRLFFCAVFGVTVNQLFFFKGLSLTGPVNAGLIMVTNPIFVLVLGILFTGELFTWRKVLGVISGLAGALLLIIYSGKDIHSGNSATGYLFILLNSLSYAVYLVMVKPLMKKYHPYTIMATVFGIGALLVLPFGWNELIMIRWETFTPAVIAATAFVIIATTFFAYLFNTLGLAVLSPSVVSIYIYLQPLLAAGFAMLLSSQFPGLIHLVSGILVFTGVYLSTTGTKRTVQ